MARAHSRLAPDQLWSAATAPRVHLQTLGACQIQVGIERLSPASETLFSLLLRLVYAPGMQMTREALLPAIWPDQPERRQRANLRQALYKLRRMGVLMELAGDEVRFDARQVSRTFATERSVERFERDVIAGHEPFGTFLPGFSPRGAELREWMYQYREVVHADVRRVLVTQLRARRERADWHGAETLGRWLLQFDPLNEEATLTMAECAALSGGKAQAVSIIDSYLHELGPDAGEIRLPATTLRRRIVDHGPRKGTIAPPERHFVGREAELTELTLALRRARWHDSSAYLLHGPPGMGKTRLTQELAKVAALEGMLQLRFACRESDSMRQLSLVLELVSELLGSPGALGCAPETLTHLRRLVGEEPVPVSAEGVPLPREPLPGPAAVRRGVIDLLAAVGEEKPVFLVLDDVHWLDVQSWDVLAQLIEQSKKARVCLLATSREAHPCAQRPESIPERLQVLKLGPLSDEQSRALTKAIAEDMVVEVEEGVRSWIVRNGEGLPLFVRSLTHHWIETRTIGDFPETLLSIIEKRLNTVSSSSLRVLQVAALMNTMPQIEIIQEVLDLTLHELVSALDELCRIGTTLNTSSQVECHEYVLDRARRRLSLASRNLLHRRIAAVLLRRAQTESSPDFPIQAIEHLRQAGNTPEVISLTVDVATEMVRTGGAHRALGLLDAIEPSGIDEHTSEKVQTLRREALFISGQHERLLELTDQDRIVASAGNEWDLVNPQEALRILASVSYVHALPSVDVIARALLIAEADRVDTDSRIEAARLAVELAGDASLRELAERAYKTGQEICFGSEAEPLSLLRLEMYYHTVFGDVSRASRAAYELARRIDEFENTDLRLSILQHAAICLRYYGDLDTAEILLERVVTQAPIHGLAPLAARALSRLVLIGFDMGRPAADIWPLVDKMDAFNTADDRGVKALAHCTRARLLIIGGDIESARTELDLAERYTPYSDEPKHQSYAFALRTATAVSEGDAAGAQSRLDACLGVFEKVKDTGGQDYLVAQMLAAMYTLERRTDALALVEEYACCRAETSDVPAYLRVQIARSGAGHVNFRGRQPDVKTG